MKTTESMTLNAMYKRCSDESYFTGTVCGRAGAEGVHQASSALGTETLAELTDSWLLRPLDADGCSAPHREAVVLAAVCEAFAIFAPQAVGYMFRLPGSEDPMSVSVNARAKVRRGEVVLHEATMIASMEGGTISIFEGRLAANGNPVFEDRSLESPSPLVKQLQTQQFFDYTHVLRYVAREALDCFAPLFLPKATRRDLAWAYVIALQPPSRV